MRIRNVNRMEMCTEMERRSKNLKPVIYIAGRYSDCGNLNNEEKWKNRNILRYYSIKFMKRGYAVICPIENDEWAYEAVSYTHLTLPPIYSV